ncbi:tetratricopeptide repeat protein [bacterium]|nr:tetratricopeptide repeat protein [bacterium]
MLRKGLDIHPNYWAAKALLGQILFNNGDIKGAKEELEAVIKIVPENMIAQNILMEIYKKDGFNGISNHKSNILKILKKGGGAKESQPDKEPAQAQAETITGNESEVSSEKGAQVQHAQSFITVKESPLDNEPAQAETITGNESEVSSEKGAQVQYAQTFVTVKESPLDDDASLIEEKIHSADENNCAFYNLKEQEEQAQQGKKQGQKQEEQQEEEAKEDLGVIKFEEGINDDNIDQEIITATLAELYFSQGFTNKAIQIYKKLLLGCPDRNDWAERLKEIRRTHEKKPKILKIEPVPNKKPAKKKSDAEILDKLNNCLKNCQHIKKARGL